MKIIKETKKKFNINYSARINSVENNNVLLWFAQPCNSRYQSINKYSFSQKQKSDYEDVNGNTIHYFELEGKNIVLDFSAELILKKLELDPKEIIFDKIPDNIYSRYTKSEKYLEQTDEVKNITNALIKDKKTHQEKIQAIFRYVANNFSYCYPVTKRGVENLNFTKLQGDCAEYSSLFVTMCRIAGIPAKNITGFVIFEENNSIQEHGWAKVYSDNLRWVDVDTQYASLEDSLEIGLTKYLFSRPEFRIEFTNGFNIPLKPNIPEQFSVKDINDLEIITSRSFVQTLQPVTFASTKPTKFSDKVSIK